MTAVTEEILLDRIKSGRLIEDSAQATERYIEGLKRTLIVSADTELISAPAYMNAPVNPIKPSPFTAFPTPVLHALRTTSSTGMSRL